MASPRASFFLSDSSPTLDPSLLCALHLAPCFLTAPQPQASILSSIWGAHCASLRALPARNSPSGVAALRRR